MFMRMKGRSRDVGGGNWCEDAPFFLAFYMDVILVGVLHLELPRPDWFWDLIWDIILSG
jgi:hypothetical protein